jgi:hypothetical protein
MGRVVQKEVGSSVLEALQILMDVTLVFQEHGGYRLQNTMSFHLYNSLGVQTFAAWCWLMINARTNETYL